MKRRLGASSRGQITLGADPLPAVEPEARCSACGARGTIGRGVRLDEAGAEVEVHRFCAACWPARSAELEERWGREGGGGWRFNSATWDTTVFVLRHLREKYGDGESLPPGALERYAEQIRALAPEIVVPMPAEVDEFLRRYGPRAG